MMGSFSLKPFSPPALNSIFLPFFNIPYKQSSLDTRKLACFFYNLPPLREKEKVLILIFPESVFLQTIHFG